MHSVSVMDFPKSRPIQECTKIVGLLRELFKKDKKISKKWKCSQKNVTTDYIEGSRTWQGFRRHRSVDARASSSRNNN